MSAMYDIDRLIIERDDARKYAGQMPESTSWLCKCGGEIADSLEACCFCKRRRPESEVHSSFHVRGES